MRKHKKRLIGILAALAVLAVVMDAGGYRLAQPERQGPEEDQWIGFYLVWERLPGEGEEIPRSGEGWVEYGSQSMRVDGLGSIRFPREILVGQYEEGAGFTFPGLKGYSAVLAEIPQEDGSVLLAGNQLMDGSTNVGGAKNSVSGTIYYGLPLGETEWPENEPEYVWRAYEVFQMPDGTVYLDGSGNSYGGAGGMTIRSERTTTETVNGEETSSSLSVEVRFEVVSRLQQVRVKQFDAADRLIEDTALPADGLAEDTAVPLAEDTRWLVVEERCQDGTVKRTVYSREEISQTGKLAHSLVELNDQGMGEERILWLGNGVATPSA